MPLLCIRLQSQVDEDGIDAAREAAIGAIRSPVALFQEQRNMLESPAIRVLANNPDTADLHGLLRIFQEEKLQDYCLFSNKDAVLSKYNLNDDECTRHMRILSLCSLAAEAEEVPYDLVASTLDIPPNDVESWVIAAVSSGLLSAKMDQIQQKIMVERSVIRKFDMEQWKSIQSQLNVWKQNLNGILETLKHADLASAAVAANK
jgi:translation initiation factor 3 subunit M